MKLEVTLENGTEFITSMSSDYYTFESAMSHFFNADKSYVVTEEHLFKKEDVKLVSLIEE